MANVALAYDLDNTLIRGNHPSIILEARGVDVALFWKKVTTAQREARCPFRYCVSCVFHARSPPRKASGIDG